MRQVILLAVTIVAAASCSASSTGQQPPPGGSGGGSGGAVTPSGSGGVTGSGGAGAMPAEDAGPTTMPMDAVAEAAPPVDAPGAATDTPVAGDRPMNTSMQALLYTYRTGFRHTSAVPASQVLRDKLMALGFTVQIVDENNGSLFTDENLAKFRLVVMVQSSGSPVGSTPAGLEALTKFVRNGGALAGFHAATDVGYPATHPYVALIGGKFIGHPGGTRTATCTPVAGATHPAIQKITAAFQHTDEIYTYSGQNPANQVILRCSAFGGGDPVPITWHRTEGAGRIFYTGLGHVDGLWTANSTFVNNHFLPGVLWAAGL